MNLVLSSNDYAVVGGMSRDAAVLVSLSEILLSCSYVCVFGRPTVSWAGT